MKLKTNRYQVSTRVRGQVWGQIIEHVENRIDIQVWVQTCNQVEDQVRDRVWRPAWDKVNKTKIT